MYRDWTRDDPAADADDYAAYLGAVHEDHKIGRCAVCGDDLYDDADYYDLSDLGEGLVHYECEGDFMEKYLRRRA